MIIFKRLRFKNILSTGNVFSEVDFDHAQSNLIVGTNGAGKSTILDALCFALYNKPFRKINKPNLVNSINKKELLVEVEFRIGKANYLVRRGIKPNVFEIVKNDEVISQESSAKFDQERLERDILKMSYKAFTQIVVLGASTFTPFMQLTLPERRAVIEDLLDIQIFGKMNSILKDRVKVNKDELTKLETSLSITKRELDTLKAHLAEIRNMKSAEVGKLNERIAELESQIKQLEDDNSRLSESVHSLQEQIKDRSDINDKLRELESYGTKIDTRKSSIKKEVDFYNRNDDCPTCRQPIAKDFKKSIADSRRDEYQKLNEGAKKLAEKLDSVRRRLDEISEVQNRISEEQFAISRNNSNIQIHQTSIKSIRREIEDSSKEPETVDEGDIKRLAKEHDKLKKSVDTKTAESERYKYAAMLLKDGGIKANIIKQYIPVMNASINKYLSEMDLFVQMEIDEEFNETIKSRHRDSFSYFNFSEGEKLRIDLALLFTWRDIARMRNSISANILFMDEILDSSLDESGTDDFLKIIRNVTKDTSIYIISHKGEGYYDKFQRILKVNKVKNFSEIEEIV
jgi:DNA repair exonuclease SbcCD ATPase subunit